MSDIELHDVIGDVHGHADQLMAMLAQLGYERHNGCYSHPERQVIFTGDFIDRGTQNLEVLDIVIPMVEHGAARAVMGNHEYNAICFHTAHPETGDPLRAHSNKNVGQHQAFINEVAGDAVRLREIIEWFKSLPLFLDLPDLRVVHAAWSQPDIKLINDRLGSSRTLTDDFLVESATRGTDAYNAIERLLKGQELPLPDGYKFADPDGHIRSDIRVKWWEPGPHTYKTVAMVDDSARSVLPDTALDYLPDGYPWAEKPVFFGHYWMMGQPQVATRNVACVDYSVAKPGGRLCCYQYNNEAYKDRLTLQDENFKWVER